MKTKQVISRLWRISAASMLLAAIGHSVSCMTTYDANGNPVQSVDPAAAVAGAAAVGLAAYAIGNHNNDYYHHGYHGGGYYGGGYYGGHGYNHYGHGRYYR